MTTASRRILPLLGAFGVLSSAGAAHAQTAPTAPLGSAGSTTNRLTAPLPGQVGSTLNQTGPLVGQVGQTANNLVGGLQPTLQPVTSGVGNALDNLTQPNTVNSLLEFLSSVIPNHIEAHVNLDALRVDKLTVDVRGVDLRNLRVDLLVANSRGAGAKPAMTTGTGTSNGTGTDTGTTSGNTSPYATQATPTQPTR